MKCCNWNPQNHTSWHCPDCCHTDTDYRDRDKHVALNHPKRVLEHSEAYYHYYYGRRTTNG